ncbi:hypothetical protein Taro_013308 [Colocasia esculenta]|uniref:Acyl-coenzyme A oxidase n=1 Tax=Colocasia esculenta TaxID=4460 RepID=A0A843UB72_COLES|nr:hypothetical protein [Colocasia esculenta]
MASRSRPPADPASRRASAIARHLRPRPTPTPLPWSPLEPLPCLQYSPPESSAKAAAFDVAEMRRLMDGHDVEARDWAYGVIAESPLFWSPTRGPGGRPFLVPDYNQSMEQQREMILRRIVYLVGRGVFNGWLTGVGKEAEMRRFALLESIGLFDHSINVKIGVHFFLWGLSIRFLGTKRHHEKWLKDSEDYLVKGCFAMTELGHGSNVRGIETVATYDSTTGEFIINTPCESAQKYWIGGAAKHAMHTVIFAQLYMEGKNQGVHAFVAQIRNTDGNVCANIRIADCGHKIGLNGVDNGRIWFDNLRVPRENLLNSVSDVLLDGRYRFAAFLAPLTIGRVNILTNAVYTSKVALAIAIRYSLTRRAFSITNDGPEVLLLDYPSHQRRLLPLVAKTCAMSFAANHMKRMYVQRTPELNKAIHVYSSAFKATFTWHNMRTLQECREACGGQGIKTENRVGMQGDYDVQSTFEGDNHVLMQQVSKSLLAEYIAALKRNKPLRAFGLEHMNNPCPSIPDNLSSSAVRGSQFQMDVFYLRERDLLSRLAKEVSKYQGRGESKEYAAILSYQVAEELGKAFAERVTLQTILEAEMTALDGQLKDILGLLRCMYALISIEEDSSFLRYGYLSPSNAATVRKEVENLLSELRPQALAIVDSFGIPPAFLSPLAFDWIATNSWSSVQQ